MQLCACLLIVNSNLYLGYEDELVGDALRALGQMGSTMFTPALRSMVEAMCSGEPPPEVLKVHEALTGIAQNVKHIKSFMIENLPGGTELSMSFENFNPFALITCNLEPLNKFEGSSS